MDELYFLQLDGAGEMLEFELKDFKDDMGCHDLHFIDFKYIQNPIIVTVINCLTLLQNDIAFCTITTRTKFDIVKENAEPLTRTDAMLITKKVMDTTSKLLMEKLSKEHFIALELNLWSDDKIMGLISGYLDGLN